MNTTRDMSVLPRTFMAIAVILMFFTAGSVAAQEFQGVDSVEGWGHSVGQSVAADEDGSAWMTGWMTPPGPHAFAPGVVFEFPPEAGPLDSYAYVARYDAGGALTLLATFGPASGNNIALDAAGNATVTGSFAGSIDVDPGPGNHILTAAGASDIWVATYSPEGALLDAFAVGGAGSEFTSGISIDSSGAIILTGSLTGSSDFDPGPGVSMLTSNGESDLFVAKYSSGGALQWAFAAGSPSFERGYNVGIGPADEVYVVGFYRGLVDFDPSAGTSTLGPVFSSGFVAKYQSDGSYAWAYDLPVFVRAITVDDAGIVHLTGRYHSAVDFDAGPGVHVLTTVTGVPFDSDLFVARYDDSFTLLDVFGVGGPGMQVGLTVVPGPSGERYVTGFFQDTVDFDPAAGSMTLTAVNDDIFLARYSSGGGLDWALQIPDSLGFYPTSVESGNLGRRVALDGLGRVHLTGYYQGTVDFDPGADVVLRDSSGTLDAFIARYGRPLEDQLDDLEDAVGDLPAGVGRGERRSLLTKLDRANASIDRGNYAAAIGQLRAFIREVEAMVRSGRITAADGEALITAAEALIATLESLAGS